MEHSRESKQRLRDANIKLKMSKRKDYYKILGCSKSATEEEIKKAYKRAALKHHPDRHSHGTDEERAAAEKQFKEVSVFYRSVKSLFSLMFCLSQRLSLSQVNHEPLITTSDR